MEVHTRHAPWFGVARTVLSGGESVRGERNAMLATSFGVVIAAAERSGHRDARSHAVFTAPAEGGWVDFAPASPGDVYSLGFDGTGGWCVARDAVLARPSTTRADPLWPGFRPLFGAEPGFLEHYSGYGWLVLSCSGPVDAFTLEQGEVITITPGYLLAYPDAMQCRLRALDPAGEQSLSTGEGLLFDFAGPGTLLARTRLR